MTPHKWSRPQWLLSPMPVVRRSGPVLSMLMLMLVQPAAVAMEVMEAMQVPRLEFVPPVSDRREAEAEIGAEQAAKRVRERIKGKVLSVKRMDGRGPAMYRVKTLTSDGDLHLVYVDAVSGEIYE